MTNTDSPSTNSTSRIPHEVDAPTASVLYYNLRANSLTIDLRYVESGIVQITTNAPKALIHMRSSHQVAFTVESVSELDASRYSYSVTIDSVRIGQSPQENLALRMLAGRPELDIRFDGFDFQPKVELDLRGRAEDGLRHEVAILPLNLSMIRDGVREPLREGVSRLVVKECCVELSESVEVVDLVRKAFVGRLVHVKNASLGDGGTLVCTSAEQVKVGRDAGASIISTVVSRVHFRRNSLLRASGIERDVSIRQLIVESDCKLRGLDCPTFFKQLESAVGWMPNTRVDPEKSQLWLRAATMREGGSLTLSTRHLSSLTIESRLTRSTIRKGSLVRIESRAILSGVEFDDVLVLARPGSMVVDARGRIRLAAGPEATIIGSRSSGKSLALSLASNEDRAKIAGEKEFLLEDPLKGANLRYLVVDDRDTVRTLVAAREASIFDPIVDFPPFGNFKKSELIHSSSPESDVTHELMGQVCAEKSTLGSTRSITEYYAMRSRLRHTRGALEWTLLQAYRLVGFGRRPGSAFLTWLVLGVMEIGWRSHDGWSTGNLDVLFKAGISTMIPPAAILTKEVPATSIDLLFRLLVSVALTFLVVSVARYGRISRKAD